MNWQRLKYGTLVAAGICITGVALYYGVGRRQITGADLIELYEGVAERKLVFAPMSTVTNAVVMPVWTEDTAVTHRWPRYEGTTVVWEPYLVFSGTVTQQLTNVIAPVFNPLLEYARTVTGRFVWGHWEYLSVSGYPAGVSFPAGLYVYVTNWGLEYLYASTQDQGIVIYDRGPGADRPFVLVRYDFWPEPYGPYDDPFLFLTVLAHTRRDWGYCGGWLADPWGEINYIYTALTVRAGGALLPGSPADAPAYTRTYYLLGITWQIKRSQIAFLDQNIKQLVPLFLDESYASNGVFDAWLAATTPGALPPCYTVTGLFARLGITGAVPGAFTREPSQGPGMWHMYSNDFMERYRVLNALKYTAGGATWYSTQLIADPNTPYVSLTVDEGITYNDYSGMHSVSQYWDLGTIGEVWGRLNSGGDAFYGYRPPTWNVPAAVDGWEWYATNIWGDWVAYTSFGNPYWFAGGGAGGFVQSALNGEWLSSTWWEVTAPWVVTRGASKSITYRPSAMVWSNAAAGRFTNVVARFYAYDSRGPYTAVTMRAEVTADPTTRRAMTPPIYPPVVSNISIVFGPVGISDAGSDAQKGAYDEWMWFTYYHFFTNTPIGQTWAYEWSTSRYASAQTWAGPVIVRWPFERCTNAP